MVAKVGTVAVVGVGGVVVEVETDMKRGLPGIQIVGMGTKAIDEARERVRSAISNSLLGFPARKLTINLAPAELPKDGAHFDLAIALSVLTASGQLRPSEVASALFAGELSLGGDLKPISGAIVIAEVARRAGFRTVYLPQANAAQASLIEGIEVIGVTSLKALFRHLKGVAPLHPAPRRSIDVSPSSPEVTIDSISGHLSAKRALQIAAAGRHNLLLYGPPGTGKTLLAKALASLLPPLSSTEALEVTKLHSLAGASGGRIITARPFRSPHHTTSRLALIGGGSRPRPGEISLAHLGVLFLDELPEYPRATLEALRQPLEDRSITVTRTLGQLTYPADFMLVATMNPCACGYLGDESRSCRCTPGQILAYQKRLSGPLLDRIDLMVPVSRQTDESFFSAKTMNNTQHSKVVMAINAARTRQKNRYESDILYNASLTLSDARRHLLPAPDARELLDEAARRLGLSARAYFKTLKVARTIADLAAADDVMADHIAEALQFRETVPG